MRLRFKRRTQHKVKELKSSAAHLGVQQIAVLREPMDDPLVLHELLEVGPAVVLAKATHHAAAVAQVSLPRDRHVLAASQQHEAVRRRKLSG